MATRGLKQPDPVAELSWDQLAAWRMDRHHLTERVPAARMLDVVSDLNGLHAQLMSSAELTLQARVDDLDPDAVQQALWRDRTLVKTWAMRGTLHLLRSREYPLWQATFATAMYPPKPVWLRWFGLTADELEQLIVAVGESLDGRVLTRTELADAVIDLTGVAKLGEKLADSWGATLKPAAFRGKLVFGPSSGQNVGFTNPGSWLAGIEGDEVDPGAALLESGRRFLSASGPVTREDYSRWLGMSPAAAGRVLKQLGDEVAPVTVGGTAAWALARDVGSLKAAEPSTTVRLLPAFDQYVITATRHAAELMRRSFVDRVYRKQGWISAVLVVGGRIEGIWNSDVKGSKVVVDIEPFGELRPATRKAAEAEAERLARWYDRPLELRWVS
jgi:hypothetical protein